MNQKDAAPNHYVQIDALKGIAIFLVVLGHSIIEYPIDLHQNAVCNFIFRWLSGVHMPLFFLISGFCFSYRGEYKPFIFKKIKRILIPYLAFNLIDMFPRFLFPDLVNRSRGIGDSIQRILLEGGEYWFLYVLFLIFLIYPLLDRWIADNQYLSLGMLPLLLVLNFACRGISVFLVDRVFYYLFYFTIGIILKKTFGKALFDKKINKGKTAAAIALLAAVWLVLIALRKAYLDIPEALIGILTFYLFVQFTSVTRLFARFGEYSLQLYLLNGFLLVMSRTAAVLVFKITDPFVIVAFNMLVDFFLSYIIIKYLCGRIKAARVLMGMP